MACDTLQITVQRPTLEIQLGAVPVDTGGGSGTSGMVELSRSTAGVSTATTALTAADRVAFVLMDGDADTVVRLGWSDNDEALVEEQALPSTGIRYLAGEIPSGTRQLVLTTLGAGSVRALIHYGTPES